MVLQPVKKKDTIKEAPKPKPKEKPIVEEAVFEPKPIESVPKSEPVQKETPKGWWQNVVDKVKGWFSKE